MCVCRPNLGFSNLDHFRMLGWYQNVPLAILGLVQVLVCAGVQVLVEKICIQICSICVCGISANLDKAKVIILALARTPHFEI